MLFKYRVVEINSFFDYLQLKGIQILNSLQKIYEITPFVLKYYIEKILIYNLGKYSTMIFLNLNFIFLSHYLYLLKKGFSWLIKMNIKDCTFILALMFMCLYVILIFFTQFCFRIILSFFHICQSKAFLQKFKKESCLGYRQKDTHKEIMLF